MLDLKKHPLIIHTCVESYLAIQGSLPITKTLPSNILDAQQVLDKAYKKLNENQHTILTQKNELLDQYHKDVIQAILRHGPLSYRLLSIAGFFEVYMETLVNIRALVSLFPMSHENNRNLEKFQSRRDEYLRLLHTVLGHGFYGKTIQGYEERFLNHFKESYGAYLESYIHCVSLYKHHYRPREDECFLNPLNLLFGPLCAKL